MRRKLRPMLVKLMSRLCMVMALQAIALNVLIARPDDVQTVDINKVFIDVDFKNASLAEVFRILEAKTELTFGYDDHVSQSNVKINFAAKRKSVAFVLNEISAQASLEYKQTENAI